MTTRIAFAISEEDVENVLRAYSLRVKDAQGKSFETMAEELIDEIDHARVEKAALRSEGDLEDQIKAAFDEIKKILVELGVLDF
jgi:hypothetical protein